MVDFFPRRTNTQTYIASISDEIMYNVNLPVDRMSKLHKRLYLHSVKRQLYRIVDKINSELFWLEEI